MGTITDTRDRYNLGDPVLIARENLLGTYLGAAHNRIFVDVGDECRSFSRDELIPVPQIMRDEFERDAYKRVMNRTTTLTEDTHTQYGSGPGTKTKRTTTTTEHESSEDAPVLAQHMAPPGFEGVVKKIKKDNPGDKSTPYALAWWMKKKGYKPEEKGGRAACHEKKGDWTRAMDKVKLEKKQEAFDKKNKIGKYKPGFKKETKPVESWSEMMKKWRKRVGSPEKHGRGERVGNLSMREWLKEREKLWKKKHSRRTHVGPLPVPKRGTQKKHSLLHQYALATLREVG